MRHLTLPLAFFCAATLLVHAQGSGAGAPPDGGTTEILQSINVPPLPHAPFSCTLHTEWVRLLPDGSTITLVNQRRIARDPEGRIFEERRLLAPPNSGLDESSRLNVLQFADPRARTLYNCMTRTHLCHLLTYTPQAAAADAEESSAVFPGGTRERIDLGRDMREGVEVRGTRVLTTIKAGLLGNSKAITVQRQFWYSEALGINLYSLRSDPRFGVQSFTVTDLSRDVPHPSLFDLPRGYKVVDERPAGTAP